MTKSSAPISIEEAITECERHLNESKAWGTQIEDYLTRFLLVFICSEYEKQIQTIIVDRARRTGDAHITAFIGNTVLGYKHLKLDHLRGNVLKKFGNELRKDFDDEIMNSRAEACYNNIVNNRDASAHGGFVNMTFSELKESYKEAEKVLTEFEASIGSGMTASFVSSSD